MNTFLRPAAVLGLFFLVMLATPIALGQGPTFPPARTPLDAGEPPPVPGSEDMTVQPRGPVHEAFAVPPHMAPKPGPVVAKKPPDPIPEVPPDQKPEGDNVQWIPGYWAWDAERQDYLWVSGLWRVPPEGRKWVPGTWNAVEGGYQWTPGFWAPANQEEMPYLPPPPDSIDNGPNSPQPNDDSFYVPGNWMYQSSNYFWQPGYWQAYRPGMIWTPAYYCWTPAGYLFVPGYWDWPLANRGLLFAPVVFNRPLWMTPGWFYQPSYAVAYPDLLSALFIGPTGGGFYFGNYYGPAYRRLGFLPWFTSTGGVYNPLFAWYRWRNLNNPGWATGLYSTYRGRYNGTLPQPPLALANAPRSAPQVILPLSQLNSVRLARLSTAQLAQQRNLALRIQQFSLERQALRERRLPLALSRLPSQPALAPAARFSSGLAGTVRAGNPVRPVAPPLEPRIITARHAPAAVHPVPHAPVVPRLQAPVLPRAEHLDRGIITHHNSAPVAHSAPSMPRHSAPVMPHYTPPVHHTPAVPHFTPPPHHAAPPAHHFAPPSHTGGGHSGHHR